MQHNLLHDGLQFFSIHLAGLQQNIFLLALNVLEKTFLAILHFTLFQKSINTLP